MNPVESAHAACRLYSSQSAQRHFVYRCNQCPVKRIWEHKNNFVEGFTEHYGVHALVYYELHADMKSAIAREKQIKKWNRAWKVRLVEAENPEWRDLWQEIL